MVDDKTPVADAGEIAETPADAEPAAADGFAALEVEMAEAKQAVLYAQAEVLNVRRCAEKGAADARTYAATGLARDILSVSDNLMRGLAAIPDDRSEEHTSELQALMRISSAVFCLKKKHKLLDGSLYCGIANTITQHHI